MVGEEGKSSSFEVSIDGKKKFSKLESGSYPDNAKVVEMVKAAS